MQIFVGKVKFNLKQKFIFLLNCRNLFLNKKCNKNLFNKQNNSKI